MKVMRTLRYELASEDAVLMFLALGIYAQLFPAEPQKGKVLQLMDTLGKGHEQPSVTGRFDLDDVLILLRALSLMAEATRQGLVELKEQGTGRSLSATMSKDAEQLARRLAGWADLPEVGSQLLEWAARQLPRIAANLRASHTA